jgi:hypothetical protein
MGWVTFNIMDNMYPFEDKWYEYQMDKQYQEFVLWQDWADDLVNNHGWIRVCLDGNIVHQVVENWVKSNCTNNYEYGWNGEFLFESKNDATLFSLRWS